MRESTYKDKSQKKTEKAISRLSEHQIAPELNILFLSDKYGYENTFNPIAQRAFSFFGNNFQKYAF